MANAKTKQVQQTVSALVLTREDWLQSYREADLHNETAGNIWATLAETAMPIFGDDCFVVDTVVADDGKQSKQRSEANQALYDAIADFYGMPAKPMDKRAEKSALQAKVDAGKMTVAEMNATLAKSDAARAVRKDVMSRVNVGIGRMTGHAVKFGFVAEVGADSQVDVATWAKRALVQVQGKPATAKGAAQAPKISGIAPLALVSLLQELAKGADADLQTWREVNINKEFANVAARKAIAKAAKPARKAVKA